MLPSVVESAYNTVKRLKNFDARDVIIIFTVKCYLQL